MSRSTTWRSLCVQTDPDFVSMSRLVVEYQFSSPGKSASGSERTHEGGQRVFMGDYQTRGPYAPETIASGGLVWHGTPLDWDGGDMTWGT